MNLVRHLLLSVVVAVVLRWLWIASLTGRAHVAAGRTIFPPTRAVCIFIVVAGVAFTSLFLLSWFALRQPDEWWVPYLFLGFLALDLCVYPPVLTIEMEAVGSRAWWQRERKMIRWEDVGRLDYNTGSKQFVVRAKDGRKITHSGFQVAQGQFVHDIRRRTRLPMNVTKPGTWKRKTLEVPFEEIGARAEDSIEDG
jgi:hypothetical protein